MVSSLLLFFTLAKADDFVNLRQGQTAPFDGTLLKPDALATIISKSDAELAECKAQAEHDLQKQQIDCELDVQKIEYDFGSYKVTNEAIILQKDKELDKLYKILEERNKNRAPMWIGVGFVGGLATSIGMIYAYEAITNENNN